MTHPPKAVAAAVPLVVAVVAALATPAAGAGGTAPTGDPPASEFEHQLDQMPASILEAEGALLTYLDLELVWERLGVGPDLVERVEALPRTSDTATWAQPPELFGAFALDLEGAVAEVGFSLFQIDRELAVVAPPRRIIVADITVAPSTVIDALGSDPVWSADLQTIQSADGSYFAWAADDFAQDLTRRSAFRPLGQGGQLAVIEDDPTTIVRTIAGPDMVATLGTIAGNEPSLLDGGPLAPAIAVLEGATVVQAIGDAGLLVVEVSDDTGTSHTEILASAATQVEAAAAGEAAVRFLREASDPMTAQPITDLLPGAAVTVEGTVVRIVVPGVEAYRIANRMLLTRALDALR